MRAIRHVSPDSTVRGKTRETVGLAGLLIHGGVSFKMVSPRLMTHGSVLVRVGDEDILAGRCGVASHHQFVLATGVPH